MTFKIKYIFYLLFTLSVIYTIYTFKQTFSINYIYNLKNKYTCKKNQDTMLGDFYVNEPILSDALDNKSLLRMKHIDQGGPLVYFNLAAPFSRYDHCIGVWALIRQFHGSIAEQLAGLFHDISHTAFSHVADVVFKNEESNDKHSYQDNIHLWYIKNSSAFDICKEYNLSLESLNPDIDEYTMLERPLPDMCADRIEYNLHTAFVYKLLSKEEIQNILSHLHFDTITYYKNKELITEKTWYFDDIFHAKKFALLPLHFIKTIWNASYNMVFYKFFAHLIEYSFSKKYITKDQFHFGTDEEILTILRNSNDPYIIYILQCLHNIFDTFEIIHSPHDHFDEILKGKFRGIDPLVQIDNKVTRLSQLDFEFHYLYNLTKEECQQGYKVKYKKIYNYIDFYANK